MLDYQLSAAFYVDGLGFKIDWEWRHEPGFPTFMQVSKDGLSFYLSEHAGDCQPGGLVYFYVEDVDAWFKRVAALGVAVNPAPTDQPWGSREMVVVDPSGNRLCFATRKHARA
jgi:uncharacterized glyoxalase superfamily protein PhnB